jgi:hypothetical protein
MNTDHGQHTYTPFSEAGHSRNIAAFEVDVWDVPVFRQVCYNYRVLAGKEEKNWNQLCKSRPRGRNS